MTEVLSIVVLLGSGLTFGVFFAVAVSVIPALINMPVEQYLLTHQALGKGYHPIMPIITNITTVAGLALAFIAEPAAARLLFGVAVLLLIGVQAVSHLGNVPINRSIRARDNGLPVSRWADPRPRWRSWHLVRTLLAAGMLLADSVAVILAG